MVKLKFTLKRIKNDLFTIQFFFSEYKTNISDKISLSIKLLLNLMFNVTL